jgi:tellurite resistance protein TehA-like permease
MATGIVSIAASVQGLPIFSDALLALACAGWIVLAAATSWRMLASQRRRPRLQSFALVAATAVVGARFALAGERELALALWCLALLLWLGLLVRRPTIAEPVGGSLLTVVAIESLALLAALLAPHWTTALLFVAVVAWALGLVLYPLLTGAISLALYRRTRFAPDLWIVMGALAVATLAGTELLLGTRALPTLHQLRRVLPDIDLVTWSLASALIVPLLAAELRERGGWRYEASRWSFVFPLGMYAVARQALGDADKLPPLSGIGRAFFAIAAVAWALALLGLARHGLAPIRRRI